MFYIAKLTDKININSKQIDTNIIENIASELRNKYENKILGRINGYIINIHKIQNTNIPKGTLNDINGDVSYTINYYVTVFIPEIKKNLDIIIDSNDVDIIGHPKLIPKNNNILCICKKDLGNKNSNNYEIGSVAKIYIVNLEVKYDKIVIIGYLL